MTNAPGRPAPPWVTVLLGLGVVSTTLTFPVLGWLWLELQFFGEVADQGDYLTAAGVALVGIGWHVLAGITAWVSRAPVWLHVWSWVGTALMVLFVRHLAGADHRSGARFGGPVGLDGHRHHDRHGSPVVLHDPRRFRRRARHLGRPACQRGRGRTVMSGIVASSGRSSRCRIVPATDPGDTQSPGS